MSLPVLAPKYSFDGSSIHRSSHTGSKRQLSASVVSSHADERRTTGRISKASKQSTVAGTESVKINHLHDPELSSIVAFVENKQREVYVNCPIFEEFTHENAEALRLFF
jgi:catabolite regulation protein CreA